MRPQLKLWALCAMSAALFFCGAEQRSASASEILDDPSHFTELAGTTMQAANVVCWELHRYHQQQPDFTMLYRDAKEIWSQASTLQSALQNGPVETAVANQQIGRMNALLANVEKGIAKWKNGVRPTPPAEVIERRGVPVGGVGVNVPFFGFRLSAPKFVNQDVLVPAPANQRAIHANGRGSRRSLERELFTLKTALANLTEDIGVPAIAPGLMPVPGNALPIAPPAEALPDASRPSLPQPAIEQPKLPNSATTPEEGRVIKVVPSSARKFDTSTTNK